MKHSAAIIGNGLVSQRHKKAWDRLGIPWKTYRDIADIGKETIIDIATPIFLHTEMIREAVVKGRKVICEKPLARTVKEAEDLILDLYPYQEDVCIIYQFRFNPVFLQFKKDMEAGKYGEIKLITVNYFRLKGGEYFQGWRASKVEAGGGVLLNVTIHYLDLLQWVFGYPTHINGLTANLKPMDVEDIAVGIMRFPTGAVASIALCSDVNPQYHMEFGFFGNRGHVKIQLTENEYHADNFAAFLDGKNYVTPTEALKSLQMTEAMYA